MIGALLPVVVNVTPPFFKSASVILQLSFLTPTLTGFLPPIVTFPSLIVTTILLSCLIVPFP